MKERRSYKVYKTLAEDQFSLCTSLFKRKLERLLDIERNLKLERLKSFFSIKTKKFK